jgi:hypothetical protein
LGEKQSRGSGNRLIFAQELNTPCSNMLQGCSGFAEDAWEFHTAA